MAYFEKNDDGNYEYSYYGVGDCQSGNSDRGNPRKTHDSQSGVRLL